MTEWYVFIDGQERGPGSTDALLGFLNDNHPRRFHVWREGFDDWKLASEVPELSGKVPSPPVFAAAEPIAGPAATTERKTWRWARFGAIGGVALALFNITIRSAWSTDPAFLAGQLTGSLFLCALIGLAAGAIHDAISGPAVTRLSDGSQFAYSGLGTIETDKAALSKRLVRALPVLLANAGAVFPSSLPASSTRTRLASQKEKPSAR